MKPIQITAGIVLFAVAAAIAFAAGVHYERLGQLQNRRALAGAQAAHNAALPTQPASYLGVYTPGVPTTIGGVSTFISVAGVKPNLVSYYNAWGESFNGAFASHAARLGAIPFVQLEPWHTSLASVADGGQDGYVVALASEVRAYKRPVIMGFGHEMNGDWYPWGYRHTAPATFIAAWRHIVQVFRAQGAGNVTWLWTVNVAGDSRPGRNASTDSVGSWWPGASYVTWIGIDGYYYRSAQQFSSLFGPTVAAVRHLTTKPVLIAETSVSPAAGQAAKIGELFAGVVRDRLLGLVWFDAKGSEDWRLQTVSALTAFREAARKYLPAVR